MIWSELEFDLKWIRIELGMKPHHYNNYESQGRDSTIDYYLPKLRDLQLQWSRHLF